MIRIQNWSVVLLGEFSPYQPPAAQKRGLHGKVYGHPEQPDGTPVTTSRIVQVTKCDTDVMITTQTGNTYLLCDIDPKYEQQYPNALQKLTRSSL